jgi:hypothetical protein
MSDKLFLVLKLIALVSKIIIIINLEVSIVYFLTIKILTAKALLCQFPIDNCGLFWELSDVT